MGVIAVIFANKVTHTAVRLFGVAVVALALCVSASGSAQALIVPQSTTTTSSTAASDDPRVDPNICETMQDQGDAAVRVMDAARAGGLITQPEPVAGLTCADQSLTVTARLGALFSDKPPPGGVTPANTTVFTPPLAYPNWGADDFLMRNLNDAITPMLTNYLGGNFGGVLGAVIGTNQISSKLTDLVSGITGPIDSIMSQMNGFSGQISGIMNAINTIQTLARALNLPMPSPVIIGAVAALEAAQGVANGLMSGLQSAMNAAIQPLIGQVMGEIMSPAADMDCNNIDRLVNGAEDAPGLRSITGSGASADTPFVSVSRLLAGDAAGGIGGGMMDQLQINGNIDILDRALKHITDGVLSGPGRTPSWRTSPIIPAGASSRDVLMYMRGEMQ